MLWLLVFVLIVSLGLSVGTLVLTKHVEQNAQKIEGLNARQVVLLHGTDAANEHAISLIRAAEYRLCLRQQVVRLVIDSDKHHDGSYLKLYDCTPNLYGAAPTIATAAQVAALRRQVMNGTAP